jgi:rhodanese-related sulfurtransferase
MNTKSTQNGSTIVTAKMTEPARTAGAEEAVNDTAESEVVADPAASDIAGESTRDLLPDEGGAWASLASPVAVSQALAEKRDIVVVDVRAAEDFAKSHVPGAVSLPREKWSAATGLSKEKVNVVYCYSGTCPLGGEACAQLAGQGYPVVEMDGGFDVWDSSDFEVEQ